MIAVFGTLRFPPEALAGLRPHLKTLIEVTRTHDDCIAYDVAEDMLEPGLLRFSELWPDADTFARHMIAPHIVPWRAACTEHGLIERKFDAYDAQGPKLF